MVIPTRTGSTTAAILLNYPQSVRHTSQALQDRDQAQVTPRRLQVQDRPGHHPHVHLRHRLALRIRNIQQHPALLGLTRPQL